MTTLIAWLLLGCRADAVDDRVAYAQVVGDPDVAPAAGLARCLAIDDADLAGDCALYVATVEARREAGRPETVCEQVPRGVWRDECWFASAEIFRRRHRDQYAATLCLKAGSFINDCGQHLWQGTVYALAHEMQGPGFMGIMEPAQRVHDHWARALGADTDFHSRYWAKVFQNGFEGQETVDLAWCDALAGRFGQEQAERCVSAALQLYDRELGPRLDRAGVSLCEGAPPDSTTLQTTLAAQHLRTSPDARLDGVLVRRRERECGAPTGASLPDGGGVSAGGSPP